MKVKNKKTLVAIIAVLLVLVVGATIAYFQSSASFENVFNTGTYKVVTTEVFESPDNWKPGEEIQKKITTKNEGTIDAAVRVSYTEQWLDENNQDITSQITAGTAIINLDNTSDWTKEGNYYYYNYILKPTESTSSFMKSVTLNPDLNGVTCTGEGLTRTCESTNPATGAKYILTLTKETVQADKYDTIWNTEVEITVKNSGSSSNDQGNGGQSSSAPTIASCPGCKFIFTTDNYAIEGTDAEDDYSSDMPTAEDGLTNDYTTLIGTGGHPYFLGLIESTTTSGKIGRAFACGVENGTPFCLEGYDTSKYSDDDNVRILNTIYPECGADASHSESDCYGSSVYANATDDGNVDVGDVYGVCSVYNHGHVDCCEW